jgi:hypothetical protein
MGDMKPEKVFIGEGEEVCYICERQLEGEQCLRIEQDNYLICFDQGVCDAYSNGIGGD